MRPGSPSLAAVAVLSCLVGSALFSRVAVAQAPPSTAALVSEVRQAFTLAGKRIPPEIFRDFGDGNLADSLPIWVTVDIRAAIDSNLYADEITQRGDWVVQRKRAAATMNGLEETAYTYIGAAANGLLVVLAAYNGGGSGDFVTLHILGIEAASAFDSTGAPYQRINLTDLRSLPLGDRWDGKVDIANNTVRIVTTRKGPADRGGTRQEMTIEATKP